jgi:DNA gyrase subunit A
MAARAFARRIPPPRAIQIRAKAEIEQMKKGDRSQIVITEIPYQVNKAKLQERIADLVRDKVLEGIRTSATSPTATACASIELKRARLARRPNNLYKHTQLQQTFGIIMLAIVAGRPRVLTLLEVVEEFVQFRREVVRRRIEFELRSGAGAHPRRPADRARQSRRRHYADSLGQESA